jgi:hypothetical protein
MAVQWRKKLDHADWNQKSNQVVHAFYSIQYQLQSDMINDNERKLKGVDVSPYLTVKPHTDHTEGKKVHELIDGMIVSTVFRGKCLNARAEVQDDGSMFSNLFD